MCYHGCKSNHFIFHQKNCKVLSQSNHIMENKKDFWIISIRKGSVWSAVIFLLGCMVMGSLHFFIGAPILKEIYSHSEQGLVIGWDIVKFASILFGYALVISMLILPHFVNVFIKIRRIEQYGSTDTDSEVPPLVNHLCDGIAFSLIVGFLIPGIFLLIDNGPWTRNILLFTGPSFMISFIAGFFYYGVREEIKVNKKPGDQKRDHALVIS